MMTEAQATQMIDLLTQIEENTRASEAVLNLLMQVFQNPNYWQPSLLAISLGVLVLLIWKVFSL